ncbi:MAG: glycoside hydrolase family 36 protein [Bacillota bacterium]
MLKCKLNIKYIIDDKAFEDDHLQTQHYSIDMSNDGNGLKVIITPREKMELVSFVLEYNKEYGAKDRFFSNGYQSWTTSLEYTKYDKMKGLSKITDVLPMFKPMAGLSSDYFIKGAAPVKGVFHSFTYTYVRSAETIELWGSLSEMGGYTIFNADMNKKTFSIEKDVEGLVITEPYLLCDIVRYVDNYDSAFDKYFSTMGVAKPRINRLTGYTSWYNYFSKINEEIILRDLEGLDTVKEHASIFQIDDGFETAVGDWLEPNPAKFPNGMKFLADKIHDKGFKAGLWLAPFNAQRSSKVLAEHPDWFLKKPSGKPALGVANWGGAYTLDIYNPEARAYIAHFFDVVLNDWGYDLVKLDFLFSACIQPRNGKSRGQLMCEAMDFLRECCGDKFILGCGVPLGPAFGRVDACRISCDVDLKYPGKFYGEILHVNNEVPSARNAINSTIFRRHLGGRVFANDPDVFFLRDFNLVYNMKQKKLLARINSMFGNVLFVSDDINKYKEEEKEILIKTFKKPSVMVISAEYIDKAEVKIVYLEDGAKKNLTFNIDTGESNLDW